MSKVVLDPVCRMEIEQERAQAERSRGGEVFWFCSTHCAELFDADPDRYLSAPPERERHQLVIIGGGPAGLTAALYASIQRLETLVISDQIGGQAADSVAIENYMGFQVIQGGDLVERFRTQLLKSRFVQHKLDRVTKLAAESGTFRVCTDRDHTYECDAVILAMGMKQRMLGVPGEQRLLHRGVSFSVVQDEGRFHGCDIAIVGGGNSALQAASQLAAVGRQLFLVAVGQLTGDASDIAKARTLPNLAILEHTTVREVLGKERVEGVVVQPEGGEARTIRVDGVFVEIGYTPDSALAADLVDKNPRGEISSVPIVPPGHRDCSPPAM